MENRDQKSGTSNNDAIDTTASKQSEDFLQSILNTTQNLIFVYDFDLNKITFVNKKAIDVIGFSPEEIQNSKNDLLASMVHPDDLEAFYQHHAEMKKDTVNATKTIEFRLRNKKNKYTSQLSRDVVFKRDQSGKAIQYVGVMTDISDITIANEQLLVKNRELQASNTELDSFSSIASHDLKEPLRKIMLFSKLVIDAEKNKIDSTSNKYLERIIVSADRLQLLIHDLISYSRTGTEKIKPAKTDLNSVLKAVKSELKELIDEKKATVSATNELPVIFALKSQITQLFVNIISNSLKYSKAGILPEVAISAAVATAQELSGKDVVPNLKYFKIAVSDNGIGFPAEYKDAIFEPFKRLHGKDDYAGTGIGLAICKKIVVNHQGFITSESSPGNGASFFIYLPESFKK